jgi:hypothetical protein
MGSTKHEKSFVDFEKPYEQNIIGLKGIIYFGVGLLLLILVTFGLMWALMNVLEDNKVEELKGQQNPMAMSDRERLPPEPRLQVAPGFGVDSPDGRVNLELREPQAEYRVLRQQWQEEWREGIKDPKSGAVTALPIDEAKQVFLQQNPSATSGPEAQRVLNDSLMYVSDSSSGRVALLKRR